MTIYRTVDCDGCGSVLGGGKTADQARTDAKAVGAHINLPGGRDICADCWERGER